MFNPNIWHRAFSTFGLDTSLDVNSTSGSIGHVMMALTGPYSGQFWQLLPVGPAEQDRFLLATQYQGAQKKLGVYVDKGIYKPILVNASSTLDQTWIVKNVGSGKFSLSPSSYNGTLRLAVNSSTAEPFLTSAMENDSQHWAISALNYINDASFSANPPSPSAVSSASPRAKSTHESVC